MLSYKGQDYLIFKVQLAYILLHIQIKIIYL